MNQDQFRGFILGVVITLSLVALFLKITATEQIMNSNNNNIVTRLSTIEQFLVKATQQAQAQQQQTTK